MKKHSPCNECNYSIKCKDCEVEQLKQKLDIARKVLKYYGDEGNYTYIRKGCNYPVVNEGGQKALKALQDME